MKRIKEIQVKNFKAFQDEQPFKINGKNVLVYGNNGSGKSSLFWALYTLLQSSTKADAGVQKYFKKYIDSDISTHQTLKNVFVDENEDSCIDLLKNRRRAVRITDLYQDLIMKADYCKFNEFELSEFLTRFTDKFDIQLNKDFVMDSKLKLKKQ